MVNTYVVLYVDKGHAIPVFINPLLDSVIGGVQSDAEMLAYEYHKEGRYLFSCQLMNIATFNKVFVFPIFDN